MASAAGSKAQLRRRLRRIEQLFHSLNQYLAREFGLRAQGHHFTEGARLLAIWPKAWKLPVAPDFQELLRDAVRFKLPQYRKALRRSISSPPPIRWGQPAATPGKITRLTAQLSKLQRRYRRTRSMYTWARMRRLKQELLRLQARTKSPTLSPAPPVQRPDPLLGAHAASALLLQQRIATASRVLRQRWQQLKPRRRTFAVHSAALVSFDYPRALSAMLLFDHFGATPELLQTWWTKFYEAFLTFIILLFQLTMPFHILLILFCQVRIAVEVTQESIAPDVVVSPHPKATPETVESPVSEDLAALDKGRAPQGALAKDPTPSSST